jgi:GT2 family glycosyltransferase
MRWRHTTLEPFLESTAGAASEDGAGEISFRENVVLAGEGRPAVSVLVGAETVCRVLPPPDATLVVHCGLEGGAASSVRFEVSVDGVRRECVVTTGNGWTPLRVPVSSPERGAAVMIRFRTVLLEGVAENTRPVWGSPALYWRRGFADATRTLVRDFRHYGFNGVMARVRAHGSASAVDQGSSYRSWLSAHTPSLAELESMHAAAATLSPPARFALLVIGSDDGARLRTASSIVQQAYDDWEAWLWCPETTMSPGFDRILRMDSRFRVIASRVTTEAGARNAMTQASAADFVVAVDAGDELAPHALFEIAMHASRYPDADIFYSDEDRLLPGGPAGPSFKPGWSPEYLLSRMYLGRLLAVRRQAVQAAGGYREELDGAQDYDIALRMSATNDRVVHVPKVLYHRGSVAKADSILARAERRALVDVCRQTGRDAIVSAGMIPGIWRVRPQLADNPRVTIVIPTDARTGLTMAGPQPLVAQCIRSIRDRTSYPHYDLLIADNGRFPREAAVLLDGVPHERITYQWTGAFNFSRKINFAVARATNDYVLLLNDDVEVINQDWLTAMLEYAGQEAIGAVGAKLFYPDGRLQHVGVATGVCGIAAHLLHQRPAGSAGCGQIAFAVRNCAAVTGACLLTRRAVYNQVGGFDERMAVDFNDVDFCLRVRAAGYRIVFTPYAKLYHHESGSFGSRVQHPRDTEAMRQIWGSALDRDPYYNPNLDREFPDCRLARADS